MTDKELRKEKDDLLDYLFEKISKVKSNTDLKEILKKVDELNVYLDKNDSPLENLLIPLLKIYPLLYKQKSSANCMIFLISTIRKARLTN